jgi:N6-L-threonylcarbamoyladenine synthase
MIILAIESSCDETGVAIIKNEREVLSHVLHSQMMIFKDFGGVVPEMASRNHVKVITKLIDEAIKKANIKTSDIDLVAVTKGPGLIGALLVGINAATAFAYANNLPIIGVNHVVGHIYAANLIKPLEFPLISLVVSGGHTELIYMKDHFEFEVLGQTLDDAVGEAYDKVARLLHLGYPGGPIIDSLALKGESTYTLPRPYLEDKGLDFSFSGLKSAVANICGNQKEVIKENLAASFQDAVLDVLMFKIKKALSLYSVKQLLVVGGVAANKGLRERLKEIKSVEVIIPELSYCTDNAMMIAAAAYHQHKKYPHSFKNYILGGSASLEWMHNEDNV